MMYPIQNETADSALNFLDRHILLCYIDSLWLKFEGAYK